MNDHTARTIDPGAIYTAKEAARLISLHIDTLREKLRLGIVKGSRKLGDWRIKGSELLKLA